MRPYPHCPPIFGSVNIAETSAGSSTVSAAFSALFAAARARSTAMILRIASISGFLRKFALNLSSVFAPFSTTKRLLDEEGIFAGFSSGSVVYGAMRQAERMDQGNIVCLLADGGWKYLSTALWTKDYEQLEKESKGKIWW